jgi:hypothetical protein
MAIGFNDLPAMNQASAVVCLNPSVGKKTIQQNFNSDYISSLLDTSNPTVGISNASLTTIGNTFTCLFARQNSHPIQNYFDLNKKKSPYLIAAHGLLSKSTALLQHSDKEASSSKINFAVMKSSNTPPSASYNRQKTTTQSSVQTTQKQISKHYSFENFNLIWTSQKDSVRFTFSVTVPNEYEKNLWVAFALSTDFFMGDDDVCMCQINNDVKNVHHYKNLKTNSGRNSVLLDEANPSIGFSNSSIYIRDNVLTCHVTRQNSMSEVKDFYDISRMPYNLLTAFGKNDKQNNPTYHTKWKHASIDKFHFTDDNLSQTVTQTHSLTALISEEVTPLHGSLISGQFSVKWTDYSDHVLFDFTVTSSSSTKVWAAIGLSKVK